MDRIIKRLGALCLGLGVLLVPALGFSAKEKSAPKAGLTKTQKIRQEIISEAERSTQEQLGAPVKKEGTFKPPVEIKLGKGSYEGMKSTPKGADDMFGKRRSK